MNYSSKPSNNFTDMIYPANWQSLLEQYAQDASLVLIDGVIVHANRFGIEMLRAKNLNEITGMRWSSFLQFSHPNQLKTHLQAGASLLPIAIAEFCQLKTRDAHLIDVEVRLHSFPVHRNTAYVLRIRNLQTQPIAKSLHVRPTREFATANSLSHEALHHEKEILEMIALDNPLTQILQDVCDRMERLLDNGSICAIMLFNEERKRLKLAAAPSFDTDFLNEVDQLELNLKQWSCGPAIQSGKIKIVENIADSELWPKHKNTPLKYGYQSCWSVPIKTAFNSLLGTVDIYHRATRTPSVDEQTLIMDAMHVIALAIDKKNMERSLATSEDRYRSVVNNLTEGIMVIAPGGKILTCNPSAQRILKISSVDTTGRRHRYFSRIFREDGSEIKIGDDPASVVLRTGEPISNLSIGLQLHDQSVVWLLVNAQAIHSSHDHHKNEAVLISFTDTTEIRETERQLQYIATHDALTGLPNRHQLQQRLSYALSHSYNQKVAVIFLDLDRFKNVNDTAGHAAGDGLLCDVAKRLSSCIRATDMLARLGGDEFVIVVEEFATAQHLKELAERILNKMREPFVIDENQYHLGTSIGISVFPHDGTDGPTLLRCADSAMYLAKELGRNNYQFFTSELMIRAQHRYALERNLRRALVEDEFLVYYQAKVNLLTQKIVGAEALIRWQMEDMNIVAPNEFIPFAEEIGLIVPIGRWVLTQAARHAQQWRQQYQFDFKISVNISPKQFQDPNLPSFIKDVLDETGLDPNALQLEITEGLLMVEADHLGGVFDAIKQLGVSISLDDFGTGFSSLSYLQRFPIDNLKIDRSFIREIPANQDSVVLTKAIIAMSNALGMSVTAEGVESLEQMDFLKEAGCQEMQGFYFSKPLSVEAFEALLQKNLHS
ncbi:EAL domain-containing protein [Undibacterium cyanobacteriorum]|uniref:EAL domain-containing protein n=1 Tax=Undibacterium cyanobacteriorum TaxID=3073561 RepID=A0ABY9RLB7_9BURK|nr:EAL domain-containing protein [Undibacterium sp. 20NA77.5]WMW81489.1 EAL domain-containing protein [Undibacterium sp. 20NA77.5]